MLEDKLKKFTDCYFFINSKCTNIACEFRHPNLQTLMPVVCRYWVAGDCSNPVCTYQHPSGAAAVYTEPQSTGFPAPKPKLSETLCVFFVKGTCKNGENCPFIHNVNTLKTNKEENNTNTNTHSSNNNVNAHNSNNSNSTNVSNNDSSQPSREPKTTPPLTTTTTKATPKITLKRPSAETSQTTPTPPKASITTTTTTTATATTEAEKPKRARAFTRITKDPVNSHLSPKSSLSQEKTPPKPHRTHEQIPNKTTPIESKKNYGIKTLDELLKEKPAQEESKKTKANTGVSVTSSEESSSPSKKIKITSTRLAPPNKTEPAPTPFTTTSTTTNTILSTEKAANPDQVPKRKITIQRSPQLKQITSTLTNANELSSKLNAPTPPSPSSFTTTQPTENPTTPNVDSTTTAIAVTNLNSTGENNEEDNIDINELIDQFGAENGEQYNLGADADFEQDLEDLLRNGDVNV